MPAPPDPRAWAGRWNAAGVERRAAGDWRGALAAFLRAAEADPSLPEPYANAAALFLRAGDVPRARRAASHALALAPAHPVAAPVSALAAALLGARAPTAAILAPFSAGELALFALSAARSGHALPAASVVRRALETRGEAPALLFAAAVLSAACGDLRTAAWFAARLVDPTARGALESLLASNGDADLAGIAEAVAEHLAAADRETPHARFYAR
ncbi:MAG TPA: hypothetical protein VHG91_03220 [Longimicrobium sp.]|nr:hypothetical protein [Longimicrobium sp.]